MSDVVSTLGIKHGWSSGVVRGLTLIINLIAMEVTGLNGALSSAINGQIAVIAVIGGIASYLQGGKFGHGFISAGISARMGASDGIKRFMGAAGSIKKFVTQVTIGGTVSRIGGGKFANGAGSAAFSMMLSSAYGAAAGGKSYEVLNNQDNTGEGRSLYGGQIDVKKYGLDGARMPATVTDRELAIVANDLQLIFEKGGEGGSLLEKKIMSGDTTTIILNDIEENAGILGKVRTSTVL